MLRFRSLSHCIPRAAGLVTLADQAVVSLTNFSTSLIIGRSCSKEELGLYVLAWTLVTFTTETLAALITTPYTVLSPQLVDGSRRRYLGSMLVHQLLLALLFSVLLIGGSETARLHAPAEAKIFPVLLCLAVAMPFLVAREFLRRICFAQLRALPAMAIDITVSLSQ